MGEEISIVVNEIEVIGKITFRSSADLVVEIVSPFQNISEGLPPIPYFARGLSSYDGERGIREAKDILKEIYEVCIYLDENLNTIIEKYQIFKDDIFNSLLPEYMDEEKVNREREILKKQLKDSEIDEKEYQIKLKDVKKGMRIMKYM